MSLRTFADTVTIISEACPSSGWVLGVVGAHHWCMGAFTETAQEEIFGDRQDALIAGTLSWQGVATAVDGGYRVNGRWQFGSGVDHSHWVMLGCADAETRAPLVHVVVPRADIEIDDTWHVMGMCGTGSKDVITRDIFVPAHRTIAVPRLPPLHASSRGAAIARSAAISRQDSWPRAARALEPY